MSAPCKLCTYCPPIVIGTHTSKSHGRYCHWYKIRVTNDNADDIRDECKKDGDNFRWRTKGVTMKDQFEIDKISDTWHSNKNYVKFSVVISVLSLIISITAVVLK